MDKEEFLKVRDNENEEQYLWRIGVAKDGGDIDLDWDEIAALMNAAFRAGVEEYRTEAAYRKPYQMAKRFFESNVFDRPKIAEENPLATEDMNPDEIDYTTRLHNIRKEKQRMFDERTELNRKLREEARMEQVTRYLEGLIKTSAFNALAVKEPRAFESENDMIVCLSDLHYGLATDNAFGRYSPDIARERMSRYAQEILAIQKKHKSQNAYVLLMGDLISGENHFNIRIENRENQVEQIKNAAEMLTSFTHALSGAFSRVYVNSVPGNHSRTFDYGEGLRGNRLDNLISWYMRAALSGHKNVTFIEEGNPDDTVGAFRARGKDYVFVHGDFDTLDQKGLSRLMMMVGFKPEAVLAGHLHCNSMEEVCGVKMIRSGGFMGTGDNYSVEKRLTGLPSQMVCVINERGIECCYPVSLLSQTR